MHSAIIITRISAVCTSPSTPIENHDLIVLLCSNSNNLLWISAVTALQRIVETIPNFLSLYLQDIIVIVSVQSHLVFLNQKKLKGYKGHLPIRLKALRY